MMDDLKASETAAERDTSPHVREYDLSVCSTTRMRVIWGCQVRVAVSLTYRLNVFTKRSQALMDLVSAHVRKFSYSFSDQWYGTQRRNK